MRLAESEDILKSRLCFVICYSVRNARKTDPRGGPPETLLEMFDIMPLMPKFGDDVFRICLRYVTFTFVKLSLLSLAPFFSYVC